MDRIRWAIRRFGNRDFLLTYSSRGRVGANYVKQVAGSWN